MVKDDIFELAQKVYTEQISLSDGLKIAEDWSNYNVMRFCNTVASGYIMGGKVNEKSLGILLRVSGMAADEMEKERETLERLALVDKLTEIGNRVGLERKFDEEYARLERENIPFAILMTDIDDFKGFNTRYGHAGGDITLKTFAQTAVNHIRPTDGFYRFGGEEFAGVFTGVCKDKAIAAAEHLRKTIEKTLVNIDDKKVGITFSGGLYLVRRGDTLEKSVKLADKALYEAKNAGKNQIVLYKNK